MSQWIKRWGPALLWMGLLFYLSSRSTLPVVRHSFWNTVFRKGGHALAYATLAVLYLRGLSHAATLPRRAPRFWAWLLAALYAATDEIHQGFTPGRHATLMDWLIDSLGAGLGLLLYTWSAQEFGQVVRALQRKFHQNGRSA